MQIKFTICLALIKSRFNIDISQYPNANLVRKAGQSVSTSNIQYQYTTDGWFSMLVFIRMLSFVQTLRDQEKVCISLY